MLNCHSLLNPCIFTFDNNLRWIIDWHMYTTFKLLKCPVCIWIYICVNYFINVRCANTDIVKSKRWDIEIYDSHSTNINYLNNYFLRNKYQQNQVFVTKESGSLSSDAIALLLVTTFYFPNNPIYQLRLFL